MPNENKTYHCTERSVTAYYTDTQRHFVHMYESEEMNNLQLFGNSYKGVQYQDMIQHKVFESDQFSQYQTKLYKQALLGLKLYSDEEIKLMSFKEKLSIEKIHRRAQKLLNEWKQIIVGREVDNLLLSLFPHSTRISRFVEETSDITDDSLTNYQSFAELGVSKEQIAQKLIESDILPKAFFNLKVI